MKRKLWTAVLAASVVAATAVGLFAADGASADQGIWEYDWASTSYGNHIEHDGLEAEVWAARDIAGNPADFSLIVAYDGGGFYIDVESFCVGADPPMAWEWVTSPYEAAITEDCPNGDPPYRARGRIWD